MPNAFDGEDYRRIAMHRGLEAVAQVLYRDGMALIHEFDDECSREELKCRFQQVMIQTTYLLTARMMPGAAELDWDEWLNRIGADNTRLEHYLNEWNDTVAALTLTGDQRAYLASFGDRIACVGRFDGTDVEMEAFCDLGNELEPSPYHAEDYALMGLSMPMKQERAESQGHSSSSSDIPGAFGNPVILCPIWDLSEAESLAATLFRHGGPYVPY